MAKPATPSQGLPAGDGVRVADALQAKRLHDKAQAGRLTEDGLQLSRIEAAYCVGAGWLLVAGHPTALAVLGAGPRGPPSRQDLAAFLVYRDLRERGFVARHAAPQAAPQAPASAAASATIHAAARFDVHPRGQSSGPVDHQVAAFASDDPVRAADLLAAEGIVLAVVDDDSVVTHYTADRAVPTGTVTAGPLPAMVGHAVAGRVRVDDPAAAKALAAASFGTPDGDGVFLSLLEAEALRRAGVLRGPEAPVPTAQLLAYQALRAAGVVPKSGLRFGAHLRGYRGAPDEAHADWLVHCAAAGEALPWSALSRGVRLAHGVRKQFLVALPAGDGVVFVRLAWRKL